MRKNFRRVGVVLLILCVFASAVGYIVCQTPLLTRWLIHSLITRALPDAAISKISISRQSVHYPPRFQLSDLIVEFNQRSRPCRLSLPEARLDGLSLIFSTSQGARVLVRNFEIQCTDISIGGLNLEADLRVSGRGAWINGEINAGFTQVGLARVEFIQAHLNGDSKQLTFSDFTAQGYQGTLTGKMIVYLQPTVNFDIQMDLNNLDIAELKKFNASIFSQMEGKLYGRIRSKGTPINVEELEIKAHLAQGAKMKATLMKYFASYLPSVQRKDLEALIQQDALIPVERAVFGLSSVNPRELTGLMQLSSKRLNVQLNVPITIKTDGRWDELIHFFQRIHLEKLKL